MSRIYHKIIKTGTFIIDAPLKVQNGANAQGGFWEVFINPGVAKISDGVTYGLEKRFSFDKNVKKQSDWTEKVYEKKSHMAEKLKNYIL